MDKFKNFQGKTLDEAILEACGYYGVPREKLEIEIVNDAKSGIFGLVGVKKAEVRAARMQVAETLSAMLGDAAAGGGKPQPADAPSPVEGKTPGPAEGQMHGRGGRHPRGSGSAGHGADRGTPSGQETGRAASLARAPADRGTPDGHEAGRAVPPPREPRGASDRHEARRATSPDHAGSDGAIPPRRAGSGSAGQVKRAERGAFSASAGEEPCSPRPLRGRSGPEAEIFDDEAGGDDAGSRAPVPEFDPASIDPEELTDVVRSVVVGLAAPVVGEVSCRVDIGERWVRAVLDCGDNAGLLVGREGQTLAALQYLAGRIVAGRLGAPLRLQVDAGHYLEHREDRLRELALSLAEKVKAARRAQATRPLSAYQRRIVHLALENDPEVLTHSKGEGLQRRVYIYLKNAAGDPASAGTRSAGNARPSGRAFSTDRTRSADTRAGAPFADDTPATDDAADPDGPDPWNR
ncbi:MAG: Jag N-terminal domain-containing protein [Desulfovibrio sp.]|jgi:spoIIIJ-associated protein|nr:Jag N-terminal domain-containing protein [Desulfovibrio sp.]